MATEAPARGPRPAMVVALVLLSQAMCGVVYADEAVALATNRAPIDVPAADVAAAAGPRTVQPLWLPQTRSDWDEMVAVARVNPASMASASADGFEEVVVTAPEDLLPMPGVYEQMWGGILAPFWAVLHPTQAWRIFAPIPQH